MAPNFASILDRKMSEIERPKPLPVGVYQCTVKGLPRLDESSRKKTPFVEFTLVPLAMIDGEADDLEAMGGLANKTIRATYYLTDDALWRLNKFLSDCGIEEKDSKGEDKGVNEAIEETPGRQVLVTLKHQASDDGEAVYAQIASTAAVE